MNKRLTNAQWSLMQQFNRVHRSPPAISQRRLRGDTRRQIIFWGVLAILFGLLGAGMGLGWLLWG